jgi:hypothetical protein
VWADLEVEVEPTMAQILEAQVILRLPHLARAITAVQTMAIQAVVVVAQVLWAAQAEPVTHRVVSAASAVKAASQALPHTMQAAVAGQVQVA